MSELPSFLRLNNIWLSGLKKKSQCRNSRRCGFHPWVKKIPWRRKWQHIQYPCLDNPMDRGAWWAIVHGVTKSWTGPSDSTHMQYFTACVYYICLSIRLWMDTGCFHLLGILSNSSMDMLVQISVQGLFFSQWQCHFTFYFSTNSA